MDDPLDNCYTNLNKWDISGRMNTLSFNTSDPWYTSN